MYSSSRIAVDKGLGFDFSQITDLVKSAATAGLNIYQNQMQLKQVQALTANSIKAGYPAQSPGVYGQQYGILPMSQVLQPQPTIGSQYIPQQPRSGIDTTTMLLIGAGIVGGILVFKGLGK